MNRNAWIFGFLFMDTNHSKVLGQDTMVLLVCLWCACSVLIVCFWVPFGVPMCLWCAFGSVLGRFLVCLVVC